jgi:threonine dehydratase
MSSEGYCICFKDVEDAYENIKTHVNLTPVLTASSLSKLSCSNLFFKCEAFQKTGSFKFRGAMNAVINLCGQNENDEKHCVTHSSGNHAAALALAARLAPHSNMKATIVMPENAPIIKVNGVIGFGGNIVFVESTNEARESKADEIVLEQKAYFVVRMFHKEN